jgi:hypothetical protein
VNDGEDGGAEASTKARVMAEQERMTVRMTVSLMEEKERMTARLKAKMLTKAGFCLYLNASA